MSLLVIVSLEWVFILFFTFLMMMKYAHKDAPILVKIFTFIGWFMGFSIIAILPLDVFVVNPFILSFLDYLKRCCKCGRK